VRPSRPKLKGLWQAFDETTFGQDRTLNLRESLPSAVEARARAESWLRMRQVMKPGDVLVITGRGNQSVNGVGVVREAIMALLPSLRRRGVVESWREHTPGSIVVTLAPVTTLLGAPRRNKEQAPEDSQQRSRVPESLAALEPTTLLLLRHLAIRTIESLGVIDATPFVEEEMLRMFGTLSKTIPVSTDREGTLQRALRSAIDELES
jgi:Smr domain.